MKGILFSPDMIQANREGRKNQTRRVAKISPPTDWNPTIGFYNPTKIDRHGEAYPGEEIFGASDERYGVKCPYGKPGDILYVKETHYLYGIWQKFPDGYSFLRTEDKVLFDTPEKLANRNSGHGWYKRPSLFLSEKDARNAIKIKNIRLEKLLDISEADAINEGIYKNNSIYNDYTSGKDRIGFMYDARKSYFSLWDKINGIGSHTENPWVWILDYEYVTLR